MSRASRYMGIVLSFGLILLGVFGSLPTVVGAAMQEVVDLATILNALLALGNVDKPVVTHVSRAK